MILFGEYQNLLFIWKTFSSSQPRIPVLRDKRVIIQFRIRAIDAIDFCKLPRPERLIRIDDAPDSFEQPLSAQNFVQSSDASIECIRSVEKRSIRISHRDA